MSAQIGLYTDPDSLFVGIGTTLPKTQLNLTSSGVAADATVLTIGGGGTQCSLGIDFTPQSSRAGGAAAKIRAEGDVSGNAGLSLWTATGGSAAAAVERLRIGADGNVGIGTTVPTMPMHIQGNAYISGSISAGNMGMFRNKIINGDMRVNQRGITTANPATASGDFSVDRFRVNIGGAVTSWSHGQYTLSSTTDATVYNQGFRYALQVNRGSGGTALHLRQYFELSMIEDLYNAPVCISFWAKSSIAGNLQVRFAKTPDGTTSTFSIDYTCALTTSWTYFTVYVPVFSPTSSTGSTTGYGGEVLFRCEDLANTTIFQLTGLQVERGTMATPFEFRPLGLELSLCQRYYEIGYLAYGAAYVDGANRPIKHWLSYKVEKRINPPNNPIYSNTNYFNTGYGIYTAFIYKDGFEATYLAGGQGQSYVLTNWSVSTELP